MKTQPLTSLLAAITLLIASSCQKQNSTALPPAPTVNAGVSQSIKLPADSTLLSGSATDAASRINGYIWSEISGPNTATITDDGSPVTEVKDLVAGIYVFQLMATDSLGQTGVDTVGVTVIQRDPITDTLRTLFPATSFSPYETMFLGNASTPQGNSSSPELLAETWTINGAVVYGRSFFQFNMTSIPAGTQVKSAMLYLFSDPQPTNGDLIHANYGSTNDFYIRRVDDNWDQSLGWNNFPVTDTTGQIHVPQTAQSTLDLSLDVTTMVNDMVRNGNHGFEMVLHTEQTYNSRIFCSSLYSDNSKHPYLVVVY